MIRAAGILFICDGKGLFVKRSNEGDAAGLWATPGGKIEEGETPEEAAERECKEELGFLPRGPKSFLMRRVSPNLDTGAAIEANVEGSVDFTTFLQRVNDRFDPILNEEHTGYCWASLNDPPYPLHPGVAVALRRLGADELQVAQMIANNEITSPQRYDNFWLFAIRVTGTGMAYRRGLDEHVWRDPSLYLNDSFLARCAGLPVIFEHPEKRTLDSKEFSKRTVGAIMFAYIRGQDVWCIARIYDDDTATLMENEQLSTSPAVVFRDPGSTSKIKFEDGSTLLVEGKPSLIDHLAICENGVWDKGGPPVGVQVDSLRADADVSVEPFPVSKVDQVFKELKLLEVRLAARQAAN